MVWTLRPVCREISPINALSLDIDSSPVTPRINPRVISRVKNNLKSFRPRTSASRAAPQWKYEYPAGHSYAACTPAAPGSTSPPPCGRLGRLGSTGCNFAHWAAEDRRIRAGVSPAELYV